MDFDVSFEETRLMMLLKQCIYDEHIKGRIIFFCSSDEPIVDVSTWRFNDGDLNILKESNYKFLLLQLLDCIAEYRSQFDNLEYRGGIVPNSSPKCDTLQFKRLASFLQKPWLAA